MLDLLKTELVYNKNIVIALFALPVIYTLCLVSDIVLFQNSSFWGKYFWSAFIGLGTYLLIYTMWIQRVKEKRDRLHLLLPVSIKNASCSRILVGLLPFAAVTTYLVLIHSVIFTEHSRQLVRILAQLSFMLIFLALVLVWRDLYVNYEFRSETRKNLFIVMIVLLTAAGTIVALYFVLIPLADSTSIISHEPVFLMWGLILCGFAYLVFRSGRNYTS